MPDALQAQPSQFILAWDRHKYRPGIYCFAHNCHTISLSLSMTYHYWFAIFWIFWSKVKITKADTPTIWMDCHPILTNWRPNLCHPHHFTPDDLPGTTLPIHPGLGHAPNMLACITSGPRITKKEICCGISIQLLSIRDADKIWYCCW